MIARLKSKILTRLFYDRLDYPTWFAGKWWSFEIFLLRLFCFRKPPRWVCSDCGVVKYYEAEIMCWACGVGEMIYKPSGFLYQKNAVEVKE